MLNPVTIEFPFIALEPPAGITTLFLMNVNAPVVFVVRLLNELLLIDVLSTATALVIPTNVPVDATDAVRAVKLLPLMLSDDVAVPVRLSKVTPSNVPETPSVKEIVLLLSELVNVPVGALLNCGT